jgi:hypothetical protein
MVEEYIHLGGRSPVALQGTIDTFELTEVVRLLAAGAKTGVLRLDGNRGTGGVWVKEGQVTAVAVDHAPHAEDFAEAMFELLRFDDGSFTFEAGPEADDAGDPADVDEVLTEAEAKLAEWREIERVVPTTRATVSLRPELSRADVVLDKARWRLVAAIGGGATVATVGDVLGLGELPISRAVKDLVELGVVELDASAVAEPEPLPTRAPVADPVVAVDDEPVVDPFAAADAELADLPELTDLPDPAAQVVEAEVVADGANPARAQLDEFAVGFGLADPPPMADPAEGGFADFGVDGSDPLGGPLFGESDPMGDFSIDLPDFGGESPAEPAGGNGTSGPAPSPLLGAGNDAAEVARQLSNLSPAAARAVAAAAKATTEEEREAALAAVTQEGEAPIDRELLLRFLASVKS